MDAYRQLQAWYADSTEAKLSHATLGRLLLDRGDAARALREFDAYLLGGAGPLGEEALAGRALALQRLGRSDEEGTTWRRMLTTYPASIYAAQARARLQGSGLP